MKGKTMSYEDGTIVRLKTVEEMIRDGADFFAGEASWCIKHALGLFNFAYTAVMENELPPDRRIELPWNGRRIEPWMVAEVIELPGAPERLALDIKCWETTGPVVEVNRPMGTMTRAGSFPGLGCYHNGAEYRLELYEYADGKTDLRPVFDGEKAVKVVFVRVKS